MLDYLSIQPVIEQSMSADGDIVHLDTTIRLMHQEGANEEGIQYRNARLYIITDDAGNLTRIRISGQRRNVTEEEITVSDDE